MNYKKMIVTVSLFIAMAFPLFLTGCAGCQQKWSHTKSNWVGLDRTITIYANDGSVIKQWETKGQVEDRGGSFRFLVDGKAITLAGTVIIEEK